MTYTECSAGFFSVLRDLRWIAMASNLSHKRAESDQVTIPDRLYFKIGDVAEL